MCYMVYMFVYVINDVDIHKVWLYDMRFAIRRYGYMINAPVVMINDNRCLQI